MTDCGGLPGEVAADGMLVNWVHAGIYGWLAICAGSDAHTPLLCNRRPGRHALDSGFTDKATWGACRHITDSARRAGWESRRLTAAKGIC